MNGLWISLGVGGATALVLFLAIGLRNHLVRLKNQVANASSSIQVMLKKRHDLIPNLISAVQAFMGHERELIQKVTELRTTALKPDLPVSEKMRAEGELSRALSGILVAVENYPQLKSDGTVLRLQASLNETEEQISAARRFYNAAVTEFNTALEVFPSSLLASRLGYRAHPLFEATEAERAVPAVDRLFAG